VSRWRGYYQAVAGRPPRETLVTALDNWEREHTGAPRRQGVDLGCGEGRDTVEFLRRGWHVLAIDSDAGGLERLTARTDLPRTGTLATLHARMEDADWPAADVINCSFALPFCAPDRFPDLWRRIVGTLNPAGRFAGQMFGPDDDWANPGLTIVTRAEVDALLAPFAVEHLEEQNRPGKDAMGNAKHWHLFNIGARKR
jgi:SAM-dependent methyltransferase